MNDLAFTAFDVLVAVVLLLSVVVALARGAVREILSLLVWVGAAFVAWYGFAPLRPVLAEPIGHPLLTDLATFAVVFVVPLVVLRVLAGLVARRVEQSGFALLDRLFGLVYGFVRGAFLLAVAYLALLVVLDGSRPPEWIDRAATRPYVEQGARLLARLLPPGTLERGRAAARDSVERARRLREGYDPAANRALDDLVRRLP